MSKHVKHLETLISVGDVVRLHLKLIEAGKERTQIFEGLVLGIKGRGDQKMLTVRKVTGGIGIERIIPLTSPRLAKIEVKKVGPKIHHAKRYNARSVK